MNKELIRFHCGGEDRRGRTLNDMLTVSNSLLESSHDYVQWLFPTVRPSDHIKNAPVMDYETIQVLNFPSMQEGIIDALWRFWDFYNLSNEGYKGYSVIETYGPYNHNYKRLTRMLDCFSTLNIHYHGKPLTNILLEAILPIPTVPNSVKQYWVNAAEPYGLED